MRISVCCSDVCPPDLMRLGFAAFEFLNHAHRNLYYSSGRPVASTSGRPIHFYTRREQPVVDMNDSLGWFIPQCRDMGFDAIEGNLAPYLDNQSVEGTCRERGCK